jgi:arginine decarboxylase
VRAEQRSSVSEQWVGPGIGWTQTDDDCGWFVEHEVVASDRADVARELHALIEDSLTDLRKHRGRSAPKFQSISPVAPVVDSPVCALAVAIYASESWTRIA